MSFISLINIEQWAETATPAGRINIRDEQNNINISMPLEPHEAQQLQALAYRLFEARQAQAAQAVAEMRQPALIEHQL